MNAAHSLIRKEILANSEKCGVRLSATLESHLVSTTVRYLTEEVEIALLTTRLVRAGDENAGHGVFRKIGDDCLVSCALFPETVLRRGGSVSHYANVGRTSYDAAGLTEAAYGFGVMMDVLGAFREEKTVDLLDLARAGSVLARHATDGQAVVPFVGKPRTRF